MRLGFVCKNCTDGNGKLHDDCMNFLPVNETGIYSLTCKRGHETLYNLSLERFEVLAEVALQAISDGYYRDAVSSFTASLERFYEFYVTTVCEARGIAAKDLRVTWKVVKNQSERQLGMFLVCYLLENGCTAPVLTNHQVAFRNKVTHQGYIPNKDEALAFGQTIVDMVQGIVDDMRERYPDQFDKRPFGLIPLEERYKDPKTGKAATPIWMPMVYNVAIRLGDNPKNLAAELEQRENYRR